MMGSSNALGTAPIRRSWPGRLARVRFSMGCVGVLFLLATPLRAVIIAYGDGSGNTQAPADDPGFENVGIRGSGTAIYLGGGWVLTAAHVGAGKTLFENTWYDAIANSALQLANPPGAGYTTSSDLMLYQIQGRPNLPSLSISGTAPAVGWDVTMIGNGRDRSNSQEAYWTPKWAPSASPTPNGGYIWAGTNDIRWGTNVIDTVSIPQGIGAYSETAFATSFSDHGTTYEAQGSPGDSGGAVFHKDNATGTWSLTGVMFTVNSLPGQPWGTSVFGDLTYSADLSVYRGEIEKLTGLGGPATTQTALNGSALVTIASNWLKKATGVGALGGDLNGDRIVNGEDIALIASNWLSGATTGTTKSASAPEPSTLALASLAALAALIRGRFAAWPLGR